MRILDSIFGELGIPNCSGAKFQGICLYFKKRYYFGFAEGRRRLGIKNKLIYFVLLSACTTFATK